MIWSMQPFKHQNLRLWTAMLVPVILEPSVFLSFAPYLNRRSLHICATSCRQSLDHAYASDVWQAVDLSQWQPLDGQVDALDTDLWLALKRVPCGRLRRLQLSPFISNEGLKKILMMQKNLEELVIHGPTVEVFFRSTVSCLSGSLLPQLRRLELAVPLKLETHEMPSLEMLVLHLPALRDLQDQKLQKNLVSAKLATITSLII